MLLLLAHFGKEGKPETVIPKMSQETLAEMIGTTRSRVSFFMNRFRKLGFIEDDGGSGLQVHSSLLAIKISPLVSKVNPSHLADFAALRECSVVEAVLLLEQFLWLGHWQCLRLPSGRGVPLSMHRTCPEYLDPKTSDHSVAADVILRQEPDEEEDEEGDEGDGKEKEDDDDDDTTDDGYSE